MEIQSVDPQKARTLGHAGQSMRVIRADGSADPRTDPGLDAAARKRIFAAMVRSRAIHTQLAAWADAGHLPAVICPPGAEGAAFGAAAALREDDWIFGTRREAPLLLWRGLPLSTYAAHLLGRASDPAHGRQIPGQMTSRALGVAAMGSPTATHLTHATGLGWAARQRGHDRVAAAFFGASLIDAAEIHTALNFAGVFRANVVFVCSNTQALLQASESGSVTARGISYGIRTAQCDGSDVLATYATVHDAVTLARQGAGPTLIEVVVGDAANGVPTDPAADHFLPSDPIDRMTKYLAAIGDAIVAEADDWSAAARADLDAAWRDAQAAEHPPIATLLDDVYEDQPWHLAQELIALQTGPRAQP